jgi:hypothetical protein
MVGDPEPLWRSPVEHTSAPMFGHLESPEPSAFPWAAVVAVGAACITLGLVIGFQWGRRTVPVPPVPPAVAVAKPIDTEVPVTPEPARTLETPAPAATRAGKEPVVTGPGRIIVRSTPVGAMVVVDGRPHGQTPVTVKDLALGPHTIEVARPGYVPHSARVVLSPRHEARTLSVALRAGKAAGAPATAAGTPVPTLGSIYVDSRPRGARVMIDGRFVGTSPLGVPELRPGDHTVQLDLAGRRPFSTKLAVKAGETARVTATLVERN